MNQIVKKLSCISIRNGVEVWVEHERLEAIYGLLSQANPPRFLKYEDRMINTADVVGIFNAEDMADLTRRKNGEWECKSGIWHERKQICNCASLETVKKSEDFFNKNGYYPAV